MLSDSQLTDPEVEFEALTALMSRLNRSQAEAERQPITAVQRATIRENWNGDLKNPRPVSRSTRPSRPAPTGDTERPEPQPDPVPPTLAKQLTDEAVAEFQRIRTQLKSGELDTLPQRILDNGEPLRPEMRKQLEEMFRGDVARLKLLTEHPSATAAKPSNSSVTRDPPRAGPKESFTVRYELSETAELGRRLRVDHGGFSTVAPNGNLIVLMKRMDGVWFWNPFGW